MSDEILSKLSTKDLEYFKSGNLDKMSTESLEQILQLQQAEPATSDADNFQLAPDPTIEESLTTGLKKIGRPVGIALRGGLKGTQDLANIAATPVREAVNLIPRGFNAVVGKDVAPLAGEATLLTDIADFVGLPKPETGAERVGEKLFEFGSPTKVLEYGASKVKPEMVSTVGKALQKSFTENLPKQMAQAGGAGLGFGLSEEAYRGSPEDSIMRPISGFGMSFAGALGGGKAYEGIAGIKQSVKNLIGEFKASTNDKYSPKAYEKIQRVIDTNPDYIGVEKGVLNSIARDLTDSELRGFNLDEQSVKTLMDYRITGTQPTKGRITRDPADITREENLARLTSEDPNVAILSKIKNTNQKQLIGLMDDLGASKGKDLKTSGINFQKTIENIDKRYTDQISKFYDKARNSNGRIAELDHVKFTNNVANVLDDTNLNRHLPNVFKGELNDFATGKVPFNVNTKVMFQSRIAADMRRAKQAGEGNQYSALKVIRDQLENVELKQGQEFGQEALRNYNIATEAAYRYKQLQDKIPSLKDFSKNVETNQQDFFDKFIIKSKDDEFQRTYNILDKASQLEVKNNLLSYIKNKSLAANGESIQNNRLKLTLDSLDEKLKVVFNKDELRKIKAIKNVSQYETAVPTGSYPNYSNTAAILKRALDKSPIVGDFLTERARAKDAAGLLDIQSIISEPYRVPPKAPLGTKYYLPFQSLLSE